MDDLNRVLFEIPDFDKLTRAYTVVDMHVHSRFSDGRADASVIARRCRQLGIGVAITDHNEIRGAVSIDREKDLLTIPGIEVTSREGSHLLVYFGSVDGLQRFYRYHVEPYMGADLMSSIDLPMLEIIRRAHQFSALVVFPHPYCAAYTGVCNLQFSDEQMQAMLALTHGIEAINAGNLKRWNLKSALLAFNMGKTVTAGSDGHNVAHIGRAVTYAECKPTRRAFLDAVRKRRCKAIGKEITMLRKMGSNGMKLRSSLKNYPNLVGKNLRYGRSLINHQSKRIKANVLRSINGRN